MRLKNFLSYAINGVITSEAIRAEERYREGKRRKNRQMANINNLWESFPRDGDMKYADAHALILRSWKRENIAIIVSANTTEFKRLRWLK